ncbi:beta-ketoacyl-ACP synthase II [Peptoniphilus sp. oral taxon 386]|uniref:beta-ketoacyl-ACP synthase II n=1 Tax=Peptoniphilus sp. oral taxon 386 TaxID=652713 RepID=UPI0001DA9CFB|nr:beta-ketoacyl-ACP synthase II [Peptoniphilus sp. oral taxon 386]EFI42467.1 beta-ketoacyl-acyl-carrier-protein synthase II [Peptoniphilus sp. oral taxon 386 str. F0131]
MKRRVAVTGIGFISPIGNDEKTLTENLRKGKCAVDRITLCNTENLDVKIACECKDFNSEDHFSKKDLKRMDRVNILGIVAARKAVEDSGIKLDDCDIDRVSIMVASGVGGLSTIERESFKAFEKGYSRVSPFFIPMIIANMTSAQIAIDLNVHGYVSCPVTACASSSTAILDAYRSIKDGYNDVVIAGGSEASINGLGIGGFNSMKALYAGEDINRASIPFDRCRSGFVMGEGAAILVLEELKSAKKRGAKIYGEIVGSSMTCDAGHITSPNENGKFAALAMKNTVLENGNKLEDVDYINAHGTSTPLNDKYETKAIKRVFGDNAYSLNVSSTKSMTGHLLGASGSLEAIITLIAIKNSFIPPTINFLEPDPECDLNITPNIAVNKKIKLAISNSLGFGGHNVSIAFKGCE